jgi:predicted dehydrogenase
MLPDLKVALVGCGQIADAHLQELRRVPHVRVVSVCDRYHDVARQAATRFGVPHLFDDVDAMLVAMRPDVVHVATPPQTHGIVVRQCLDAGAHVYVEKPFTSELREARDLVACAESRGRFICLGLDQLFDPAWQLCRAIARSGELGDIVHVEAVQGYDLTGPFGSLLMTDPQHWVRQLPGGLLQNVLPHTVARVADFICDEAPRVEAVAYSHVRHAPVATELRAVIAGARTTGSILFSSAIRPVQRTARVFGVNGSIEVDLDARTVTRTAAAALPGAFAKVELPLRRALRAGRAAATNLRRFCRSELQYFEGMRCLFDRFYAAIRSGAEMPITHAHAVRVTMLLDAILRQYPTSDTIDQRGRHFGDLEQVPA